MLHMDEIILSEISQPLKCKYCIIPLTWIISNSQIKKTESREVIGREWEEEIMGIKKNKYIVSVLQDEKNSGNCHIHVNVFNC